MRYYSLLIREDGKWSPQFGDYKKSVVNQEARDNYSRHNWRDRMIITTSDNQDSIDARVDELNRVATQFSYYIDLDERGEFRASVRTVEDAVLWSCDGFDVFEDGFMKHKNDVDGLRDYLVTLGVLPKAASLTKVN